MIVTAHQPNYLPGLSLIGKARQADAVIWLDEVQFTKGGYTNRQRMPDGSWLTVPVDHSTTAGPIRQVRTSDHDRRWQKRHARTIHQHYGHSPFIDIICALIEAKRPPRWPLATLNLAILRVLLPDVPGYIQSSLQKAGAPDTGPISAQLAAMVVQVGGTTYLSGPSGRAYLDEAPFHDVGVEVRYFEPGEDRSCALSAYSAREAVVQ